MPSAQKADSVRLPTLTLYQPWATFIALGVKRHETRGWSTKHRGPLAIHASRKLIVRRGYVSQFGPYEVERDQSGYLLRGPGLSWPYRLPLGAVVAVVDLSRVLPADSPECRPDALDREMGDFSPGRFAWELGSISPLWNPAPAVGHQGIWTWDAPAKVLADTKYHKPEILV